MSGKQPEGKKDFGYRDEHHLILEKVAPESVIILRQELALPQHVDIYSRAILGSTFEECVGIIAACLDIALDGLYEAADLCDMLVNALRSRHNVGNQPWKADIRLSSAELVEREGTLTLEEGTASGTIVPNEPVGKVTLQ